MGAVLGPIWGWANSDERTAVLVMDALVNVARQLLGGVEPYRDASRFSRETGLTYWFCKGGAPMADGHAPDCPWLRRDEILKSLEASLPERTPDGDPRAWLLYQPEPYPHGGHEDRAIHLWVRRCSVFTSQQTAILHLNNLLGHQVPWRKYDPLFPELWIGEDYRGFRWLMEPAPVYGEGKR